MRKTLLSLLVALMVFTLAACGGSGNIESGTTSSGGSQPQGTDATEGSASGDAVELTIWVYDYLANDDSALVQAKEQFEAENPDIKITFQPTVYGTTSYREKFVTQVLGGAGPDVIISDVVWVPQLAAMGTLKPLGDHVGHLLDEFHEGPIESVTYDGEVYGLPWEASPMAIYYNKDAYRAAGLDPDNPPTTWEEFYEAAEALTGGGKYGFAYMGGWGGSFDWLPFLWQAGGEIFDSEGKTALFNSPEAIESVEFLFGMVKDKLVPPAALTWKSWDELNAAFGAELIGMYQSGPWSLNSLKDSDLSFEWGVFHSPVHKEQATVLGGMNWVVSNNTDHVEEAVKWIEFITSKENIEVLSDFNRISARKDNTSQSIFNDPQMKVFIEAIEYAKSRPSIPDWSQVDYDVLQPALLKIVHDNADVKTTMDEAVNEANEILSEN